VKVFFYIILFSSLFLNAENYEEKSYKNIFDIPKGFGIHTDLAYSSYLIELHSSEIDSAIDYDVLELTLGASYVYDSWMWGFYGKVLVNELNSNMYVASTYDKLNNHADIDKKEFGFYVNHTLKEYSDEVWKLNMIYRYSSLYAKDSYHSFYDYKTLFDYETEGLALSLVYAKRLAQRDSYSLKVGLLYSRAEVETFEMVNYNKQDSYVRDRQDAVGFKLGVGYHYEFYKNLFFNVRADAWKLDFGDLKVTSRVGDSLPSATLKEQSFTSYTGVTWRF